MEAGKVKYRFMGEGDYPSPDDAALRSITNDG
jgi:hypothetical protein